MVLHSVSTVQLAQAACFGATTSWEDADQSKSKALQGLAIGLNQDGETKRPAVRGSDACFGSPIRSG